MAARQTHTPAPRAALVTRAVQRRGEGRSGKTIAEARRMARRAGSRLRQHPAWQEPPERRYLNRDARFPAPVLQPLREEVCFFATDLTMAEMAW